MSVLRKLINRLKMKKVHVGAPYSLEELCSMDDEELGRLYKNHGNPPYVTHKTTDRINIVSTCIFLLIAVGSIVMNSIVDGGVGILLLFLAAGGIIGSLASGLYRKTAMARAGRDAFDGVTDKNVRLWNLGDGLVIGNDDSSNFKTFLDDLDKVIWPDRLYDKVYMMIGSYFEDYRCWEKCPINDYSDENLGRLLKILLPVMKFNHDGGTLDDESFKALDDKLRLSERLEDYKNQVIPMMIDDKKRKIEAEEELNAKKRSDKTMGLVKDVLNQVPDDYDDSKKDEFLEKSVSMRRLEDLMGNIDSQREKLKGTIMNDSKAE